MKLNGCAYEKEVTQVLQRGGWPAACPDELRAHLAGCRSCADLVLVTASFQQERQAAVSAARISSPGALADLLRAGQMAPAPSSSPSARHSSLRRSRG